MKKKKINNYIGFMATDEMQKKLETYAEKRGLTMSAAVRLIVADWFNSDLYSVLKREIK